MNYICFKLERFLFNRLFVPFWKNKKQRWVRRNRITAELSEQFLKDMPIVVPENCIPERMSKENIFSIWLQGEEQAPKIVKSCWDSIRRHCTEELIILDAQNISQWIDLPEGFLNKWQAGKIKACHVADLCRVELLWKYGGYWMDATDYMCHPMPEFIVQSPFFMYMSDEEWNFFIQNCFIRAYAHHPIIGAWRDIIRAYWMQHTQAFDYFLPHRLFRHMVIKDDRVSRVFSQMPKISHNCAHVLWEKFRDRPFDERLFLEVTSEGAFQKLEYKSSSAREPLEGTFADYIVNGKLLKSY